MKSTPMPAGNFKLRGKRTRLLTCGCCEAENFKCREREKEASQQIKRVFKFGYKDEL